MHLHVMGQLSKISFIILFFLVEYKRRKITVSSLIGCLSIIFIFAPLLSLFFAQKLFSKSQFTFCFHYNTVELLKWTKIFHSNVYITSKHHQFQAAADGKLYLFILLFAYVEKFLFFADIPNDFSINRCENISVDAKVFLQNLGKF